MAARYLTPHDWDELVPGFGKWVECDRRLLKLVDGLLGAGTNFEEQLEQIQKTITEHNLEGTPMEIIDNASWYVCDPVGYATHALTARCVEVNTLTE